MARQDDSSGGGGTLTAEVRQALRVMKGSAVQLYDIAEGLDGETQEAIRVIASDLDGKQCGLRREAKGSGHLASLTVPKDRIEAFCIGLMRELAQVSDWLAEQSREAQKSLRAIERPEWYPPHARPKESFDPYECVGGPLGAVQACAWYLRQLDDKAEGDAILVGDHHSLQHVLGAVGQERLESHVLQVQFGGEEVVRAVGIVSWAAKEAQRLDAEDVAGREEVAA